MLIIWGVRLGAVNFMNIFRNTCQPQPLSKNRAYDHGFTQFRADVSVWQEAPQSSEVLVPIMGLHGARQHAPPN